VRNALLAEGIAQRQANPFPPAPPQEAVAGDGAEPDDILEPDIPLPAGALPPDIENLTADGLVSFTGPVSGISDDELDMLLLRLRTHFKRAGLSMLDGMLRRLGHRVPTERVCQSLLRIDPVRRIFERIRIRRREYRVLGPNSLWHHDGQHGKYKIILPIIF
jgi:hypothetical protein